MPVGPSKQHVKRRSVRIDDEVALRAGFAPVRRVQAGVRASFVR